uniref:Uncharacterized protein n=1 Tax=Panagrolaimus sp. ES5 TaxID=591445 RepID=A0AC34FYL8_9BILA
MNHRNETFGSGFSESGSAGFAAMFERGGGTGVRANCTLTGRAFTSGAVSIYKNKRFKKKERTSGTKGKFTILQK